MVAPVGKNTILYAVVREFAYQYGLHGRDFFLATQEFASLVQAKSALDAGSILKHGMPAMSLLLAYNGATGREAVKVVLALLKTANIGSPTINFRDRGHYLMEVGRTLACLYDPYNVSYLPTLGINLDTIKQKTPGDRFSHMVLALRTFRRTQPAKYQTAFGYLYAVDHLLTHFESFDVARIAYNSLFPTLPAPQLIAPAELSGVSRLEIIESLGTMLTRGVGGLTLFPPLTSRGFLKTGNTATLAHVGNIVSIGRIKVEVRIAGITQFGLFTSV